VVKKKEGNTHAVTRIVSHSLALDMKKTQRRRQFREAGSRLFQQSDAPPLIPKRPLHRRPRTASFRTLSFVPIFLHPTPTFVRQRDPSVNTVRSFVRSFEHPAVGRAIEHEHDTSCVYAYATNSYSKNETSAARKRRRQPISPSRLEIVVDVVVALSRLSSIGRRAHLVHDFVLHIKKKFKPVA
jgi:hypothetical protein